MAFLSLRLRRGRMVPLFLLLAGTGAGCGGSSNHPASALDGGGADVAGDGAPPDGGPGDGAAADLPPDGPGDGDAGDASIPIGPLEPTPKKVQVDATRGVNITVDGNGGSVSTTAADGTVYTLTVPAGALVEATTLRIEPFSAIDSLPFAGGLAAGFHLSPSGVLFAKAVHVSVELPVGVATSDLSGFCYAGDDVDLHLCPFQIAGQKVTFDFAHFSGGGVAHGDGTPTPGGAEARAVQELATIVASARRLMQAPLVADLVDALSRWYAGSVKPGLMTASTDIDPLSHFNEWQRWRQMVLEGPWDATIASAVASDLEPEVAEALDLAAVAIRNIITGANRACGTDANLSHARDVMAWQLRAELFGLATVPRQLDLYYVVRNLCVEVLFDRIDFPQMLAGGAAGTLSLKVGYSINETATLFDQSMRLKISTSGTTSADPPAEYFKGDYNTSFTRASESTTLRLALEVCFAEPALRRVCQTATVVRGPTSASLAKYAGNHFLDTNSHLEWSFVTDERNNAVRTLLNMATVPGNGFTYFLAQIVVNTATGNMFAAAGQDVGGSVGYDVTAHFEVRTDGPHLVGVLTQTAVGDPTVTTTSFDGLCEDCPPSP